ncbi:MAG: insulinase family protein [Acidobacteria bacterium]|nr:insulinase family protein [Acidobacteriota bacterium]
MQAESPKTAPDLKVTYTQFTLPNGLHVILHEDHSVPMVAVNVWYHVGSAREKPGRTGFAHLFEHLMFEGSGHVKEGQFDELLEAAGGSNNGSTAPDRTNYWITLPSNSLELALFLESDRMGYLLDTMSPDRVNGQRDVVKNERRQSYENRPYGLAELTLDELLFPGAFPYHWPTIGYMDDLTAASYEDVVEFFKTYYGPNNASLVIAGDLEPRAARALVEQWFADVKRGPFVAPIAPPVAPVVKDVVRKTVSDRVQLPRLYLAWVTPPHFDPGDAELDIVAALLTGGKNSRLYKRLVYDLQIAQDVSAFQQSQDLASAFYLVVTVKPKDKEAIGPEAMIARVQQVIDEEMDKLRTAPPDTRELERALNQLEASFYRRLEAIGGFGGKADQLNAYYTATGNPDYFNEDLARYRALSPEDIQAAVARFLPKDRRVELIVEPQPSKK